MRWQLVAEHGPRRPLLRWIGWFGAANAAVFALVITRYLWYYPFPSGLLGNVYVLFATLGQATVLACFPLFLLTIPIALILPSRRLVVPVAVFICSFGLSVLFLDATVFAENRFHLTFLTIAIFEGSTWFFTGVIFLIALVFQSLLAGMVWRGFANRPKPMHGARAGLVLALFWLAGQGLHIWADAVAYTPVTQFTRFLPMYYPIHAKRDLARLGWVDQKRVQERLLLRGSADNGQGQLRYPLNPMKCSVGAGEGAGQVPGERNALRDLPNILIVLVDSLRPDAIHPDLTPHLFEFRASALRFSQQYSGGNSSRMGIFSLFYGLPSTYWQTFYDLQRSPVLMDQVRDNHYAVGLFSAVGFSSPTLIDRTVFAGWPGLPNEDFDIQTRGRNREITDDWLRWISVRSGDEPFFGFVYYDPPMWAMPSATGDEDSLPMADRFASSPDVRNEWYRYRLAMMEIDEEVGRVLESIRKHRLSDDTIVIITSDHGYEFDDNKLGYIGHGSAFSRAQLRATLMIQWPGKPAREIVYRTAHHDLPVTLLQDVFGCDNPPSDYSIGRSLFSGEPWEWTMAGSYTAHAIVQPEQVIVSYPGGFVEILDEHYRPLSGSNLNATLIQESMEAQRRFFR
jgi:membrane-anchored protein YejM (alkaline phosphatase superfamily)